MVSMNYKINILAMFNSKGMKAIKKNMYEYGEAMNAPIERFKKMQKVQGGWNTKMIGGRAPMGRFALNLRSLTHGMRGFRMEMLGVMFFGMALLLTKQYVQNTLVEFWHLREAMTERTIMVFTIRM